MKKCADKCCPWGYSCTTGGGCLKDADQSKTPQELTSKPPPIATTTATQAPISIPQPTQTTSKSIIPVSEPSAGSDKPTATENPTASDKPTETGKPAASGDNSAGSAKPVESGKPEQEEPEEKSGGSPTAIIAGVVAGVAVFLIGGLIALYFCVLKRKGKGSGPRARHGQHGHGEKPRLNRSTSSFGNIISNPIVAEDTIRTDFNRSVSAQSHRRPDSDFRAVAGNVNPFDTPPRGSPNHHSRNNSRAKTPSEGQDSSIAYGGYGRNVSGSHVPGPSAYTGTGTGSRNNSPPPPAGGRSGYTTPPITPWGATSGSGQESPRGNSGATINVFADPRTLTPERLAAKTNANSKENNNTYSKFINTNSIYPYLSNNNTTAYKTDDYDPFNPDNHDPHHQTRPVTTFTAMMEEADLGAVARGAKYVPPTPKTPAGLLGPQVPGAGSMLNNNRFL